VLFLFLLPASHDEELGFRRAAPDDSGLVDIADPIGQSQYLFTCGSLSSYNGDTVDGLKDIGDVVYTLGYLFSERPAPPEPGTVTSDPDPTVDGPDCGQYDS